MANLTQKELSEKIKMNRSIYNLKENKVREFSEKEKKAIYSVLKKKLKELSIEDVFGKEKNELNN